MNQQIADNIEQIATYFNFDIRKSHKCYLGCCPIHQGDNPTAFNFYHTGNTAVGNWQCNTHGCHEIFGKNGIGLIRGLLSTSIYNWSRRTDKEASFNEALKWCKDNLHILPKSSYTSKDQITKFINATYQQPSVNYSLQITNEQYLQSGLVFPDQYFTTRGYELNTIKTFNVGYCKNPNSPMYSRAVVPLHNKTGNLIIGCSGRSVWPQCDICTTYHNPDNLCPTTEKMFVYSKWKNTNNFPVSSELYNFHRAKTFIEKTGLAVLSEGQPNIWRLFEAGFPMSLGCFGSNFTLNQKRILDTSGAHTIIIVPDADVASEKFVKKIIELCKNSYNIVTIEPSYDDDIGKCNIDTVKNILSPFINKYKGKLYGN